MKKILQAMDGVKAKTEVPSSDMKKFLTIVEGRGPLNRLTAAESLTVQTYTSTESSKNITNPVLNVPIGNKPSMIGKYFKQVEQEIAESQERSKSRAKLIAERVADKLEAANPAQQAAIAIAKKKKAGVKENTSIGTMPTTEYVKGIYAAAAENGMGTPEINAVKKQMVLAPNGEVDIMATMQKAAQVFQSPEWKQMIADLDALVKRAEQQGVKEGDLIPYPAGTVKVDVSDVYDWYKLGQHISNLDKAKASDFGKGPPQTVMAFGSEPEEHKYFKNLKRLGLKTHDLDPPGYKDVDEVALGNALQWPEIVKKVNGAMKATGWKGQRQSDDAFMYSTKGQETDDQWYFVIIENIGEGFFKYALGTVEDGDPHIDDAFKGRLPNTEASVSELLNTIRDGFGLEEGVPRLSKHISQSKLPPDSLNRRAKNQAIKRLK